MTQAGSVFTLGLHKVVNEVLSAGKPLTLQALRDKVAEFGKHEEFGDYLWTPGAPESGDVRPVPQMVGSPDFLIWKDDRGKAEGRRNK